MDKTKKRLLQEISSWKRARLLVTKGLELQNLSLIDKIISIKILILKIINFYYLKFNSFSKLKI